ncbi:MAG: helix-turn-helix transcriptional regulator [Eggerthellaceae bacterium]|nr:helix-turn-helix transcriptional regulator [Eggerthellaceae bacterium]
MSNNLVSERKKAGLTRKEVAKLIGRSEAVIGKWERGVTSPLLVPDGVALAKLYGCSVDYLAGLTDDRLPSTAL